MKYIKLYQNESDYITEIGENTEALLPNISFLGNGNVKFNPNPVREAYFKADYIDEPILSDTKRFINSIFSEMYLNDNEENLIKHNEIIEGSFTILPDTDLEHVQEDEWSYCWKNISKKSITTSSVESYIIECDEPLLDDYAIGISFAGGGGSGGSGGGFPPYFTAPENTLYDFFSNEGLDINDYRINENAIDITTVLNMNFSSFGDFYVVIFKPDSDNNPCPINTHNHYKVEETPEEIIDILNTNFVEGVILDFKLECDVEILPTDVLFWCKNGEHYEFDTVENVINNYGYYYGFGLSEDRKSIVPNENYLPGYGTFRLFGIKRDGDILTHECKVSYMNENFYVYPEKLGENKIRFVVKDRFAGIDGFSNNSYLTRLSKNALDYNRFVPYDAYFWCISLTSINIPNSVTTIKGSAFNNCYSLTSINIPNSVTTIEGSAFANCSGLTSVNIPNSVTYIGDTTFANCYSLTNINIPYGVDTISYGLFSDCRNLTGITIPNSVNAIGDYAFNNCYNLTNINIPDSVKAISHYAFQSCTGLTSINIPNSVTEFGYAVFSNCYNLTNINIPYGVATIPNYLFSGCTSLTNVNIPDGVTTIGGYAFANCSGLTSVNIPNSVTYIDSYAFIACRQLTDIVIPEGVTTIKNNSFNGCWHLTGVTIPNSVTSIETNAFRACRQLTNIDIPNSVTSIGTYAFGGSSGLTNVNIPNSVTSIGNNAFNGCTSLTNITCLATTAPSVGSSTFYGVSTNGVLKVPTGSNYSTWKTYLSKWTIEYI